MDVNQNRKSIAHNATRSRCWVNVLDLRDWVRVDEQPTQRSRGRDQRHALTACKHYEANAHCCCGIQPQAAFRLRLEGAAERSLLGHRCSSSRQRRLAAVPSIPVLGLIVAIVTPAIRTRVVVRCLGCGRRRSNRGGPTSPNLRVVRMFAGRVVRGQHKTRKGAVISIDHATAVQFARPTRTSGDVRKAVHTWRTSSSPLSLHESEPESSPSCVVATP